MPSEQYERTAASSGHSYVATLHEAALFILLRVAGRDTHEDDEISADANLDAGAAVDLPLPLPQALAVVLAPGLRAVQWPVAAADGRGRCRGEVVPKAEARVEPRAYQRRSLTLEAENQSAIRLSWSPRGLLYELLAAPDEATRSPSTTHTKPTVDQLVAAEQEKEGITTLTGRLKSQPKPGRPDAKGHPTAWARFAAHEDGHDGPHLYSATFHRHTGKIALMLPKEAQITVQGYAHPVADPSHRRLDTFSVINHVSYPGKPEKLAR